MSTNPRPPSTEKAAGQATIDNEMLGRAGESGEMAQGQAGELNIGRRLHHLVARLMACTELHLLLEEVLDAAIEIQHACQAT